MARSPTLLRLGHFRCRSGRALAGLAGALLGLVLLAGCDYVAVTDEQFVKKKMREHDEAVTARDWRTAASFYDLKVQWQQGAVRLEGRAAAEGFLSSLNSITQMDEFFTIVNEIRRVKPDLIEAQVTMQAHLVISSAQLDFSNRFWDAKMGWVKRGPANWKIAYIIETTPRRDGKLSRI